jgi:hypothetical protein
MPLVCLAFAFLLTPPAPQPPEAAARKFEVVNGSPQHIRAVHVSPSRSPQWGPNLLAKALAPGERATVNVAGECGRYDVRLVAEKGMEFIEDEVELCADGDVLDVAKESLTRSRRAAPAAPRK